MTLLRIIAARCLLVIADGLLIGLDRPDAEVRHLRPVGPGFMEPGSQSRANYDALREEEARAVGPVAMRGPWCCATHPDNPDWLCRLALGHGGEHYTGPGIVVARWREEA